MTDEEPVLTLHFLGTGDMAPRSDIPAVERHSVVVIIQNPNTGGYLCVDAKNQDSKSFVMDGIENLYTVICAQTNNAKSLRTKHQNIALFGLQRPICQTI